MPCPYCGAALAEGARLCTTCGRLIAPRLPGQPSGSAPTAPPPAPPGQSPPGPRPVYQPGSSYRSDPYGPGFDPASLPPETVAAWRQHRFTATFSVLVLLLVHFLTFGIASPFLLARKYAFLPKVRPDDFSTAKAAGFLFIPFFAFYWVFIFCRRIADRLALQARVWSLPGVPSKDLATALAAGWVLSAIPYLGLLVWFPVHLALWPVYLAQVQRCCNQLALEAAPPDVRSSMLALERAMRLRWLGWIVAAPCLLMVVTSLVVMVIAPPSPVPEMLVGVVVFLAIAGGGAALLYLGARGMREIQDDLECRAPSILAGYLRIDKNAAWTVAWIAMPLALAFLLAGVSTLYGLAAPTPRNEGWPSVALGALLGLAGAYAVWRAVALRRQVWWLTEQQAAVGNPQTPSR